MEDSFKSIAIDFLKAVTSELDPFTSKKGDVQSDEKGASLFTPDSIQYAVYGRGPGKKPPLDPILKFVADMGIQFEGTTQLGTAFAIINSIGNNGTTNYTPNAPNALDEAIEKHYQEYLGSLGGESVKLFSETIYTDIWKETFPEKIEFKI